MKTRLTTSVIAAVAAALAFTSAAEAAGYLKIEGIEGESKDSKHDKWIDVLSIDWGEAQTGAARQSAELLVAEGDDPVAVGLILPAVQKAREAADSSSTARKPARASLAAPAAKMNAQSMTYREVEGGNVLRTWTVHDVELNRARVTGRAGATHRLAFTYRCKDWIGADGATGSDCSAPARMMKKSDDGAQKGNVETEFQVEKGE